MKLAVAATPEVALPTLDALLKSDHEIAFIITKPDSKSGRGQKIASSPVARWATSHAVPIFQPTNISEVAAQLRTIELVVTIGYGALIPMEILTIPKYGFINLHFSLLPRWRGAAPVQRAIEAGDAQTGVTVFRLDQGMDTGPIFRQVSVNKSGDDNSEGLLSRLALLGVAPVLESITAIINGEEPLPQSTQGATRAFKLTKDEGRLDWNLSGDVLVNKIAAFSPNPGAWTLFRGEKLIIELAASAELILPMAGLSEVDKSLFIGCDGGSIEVKKLRSAGRKSLSTREWLNGARLRPEEICN